MKSYIYTITQDNITGDHSTRVLYSSINIKKVLKYWQDLVRDKDLYIMYDYTGDVNITLEDNTLHLYSIVLGFKYSNPDLKLRYILDTELFVNE